MSGQHKHVEIGFSVGWKGGLGMQAKPFAEAKVQAVGFDEAECKSLLDGAVQTVDNMARAIGAPALTIDVTEEKPSKAEHASMPDGSDEGLGN